MRCPGPFGGPGGLRKSITKLVIESVLEEEMSERLGYDKHATQGRHRGNWRNGKASRDGAHPTGPARSTSTCYEIGMVRDQDVGARPT